MHAWNGWVPPLASRHAAAAQAKQMGMVRQ